jgi:pimeloyl-ACP methyl ester carboxylesterase
MKKLVLCFLGALLMLGAACSAPPEASAPAAETPTAEATSPAPPPSQATDVPTPSPPPSAVPAASAAQPHTVTMDIESKCLEGNLAGASPERSLYIYLPPSYYEGEKAYPVVYYLHGHGEPAGVYMRQNRSRLDNAFESGAKEFIFVSIDGGASYYVNSPVSGNWEDYILTEVIPTIDATYRTIPEAPSRGICGTSMGGFGSINLALRHPDVFCAVYSMSPGLLKDDGFEEAMGTWKSDTGFLRDYSQAFAPNPDAEHLGDIPTMDGSEEDNAIVDKWMTGFGDLQEKLDAYMALGVPLKAIGFSYGTNDSYAWIPKGTEYFSGLLKENGIDNSLLIFEGGHTQPPDSIKEVLVPFFSENLDYGDD